jgi:hypothetical protein
MRLSVPCCLPLPSRPAGVSAGIRGMGLLRRQWRVSDAAVDNVSAAVFLVSQLRPPYTDCTALCLSSVLLCVSCYLAQIPLVSLYTDFLVVDIRCSFTLRAWSCASCR